MSEDREFLNKFHTLLIPLPDTGAVKEGWQPIVTAPKDGSKFLAYERGRYFDCWWQDKGYGEAYWMDEADSEPNPSVWMLLPAPPALTSGGEKL